MAHHLSSLGFRFDDRDALENLLVALSEDADQIVCPEGFYLRWTCLEGPEMWLLCDRDRGLLGFNPHFHGPARARLRLQRSFPRPDRTVLDGGFGARSEGTPGLPPGSDLFFDAPDYRLVSRLGAEAADVQITAFAHKLAVYESAEAHAASGEPALEVGSVVQTGLGHPVDPDGAPQSWAVVVGRVEDSLTRDNPQGGPFVWMSLATDIGSLDAVADPELVPEPPAPGTVVRGVFWLSGRVREYDEHRSGVSLRIYRG